MLRTRYIKIVTEKLNDGRFSVSAVDEHDESLSVAVWKNLLFSGHDESYFGTFIEKNTTDSVILDAWELLTLFARERFNQFVDWDWAEEAEICFTAAPALHEAIMERDWLPDFSALEEGVFKWQLPDRVKSEFDVSFWEQPLASENVSEFMSGWFSNALDAFLTNDKEMKDMFGAKLALLREHGIAGADLARFFTEESWLEWVGLKESPVPFTVGLRLDEPIDGEGDWILEIAVRDKKDPDGLYSVVDSRLPKAWLPFMDRVGEEQLRWIRLIPWLEEDGALKSTLTEEEAWLFLTEASETLLALGVEILLPSWWQAIKNANLKVKASLKGTSSHRPSFVGLQAMLDFNWRFSMNGVDLSEEDFQKLVGEKRRLVYVRGRWVKLDPNFIRQIQGLMKQAEKEGLHVRDLLEQELQEHDEEEDDLENPKAFARIQIELNRHWKQMIKQLSEIKEVPLLPTPSLLQGELRPYQQFGMSWLLFLRQHHFGAVLADDMGLGKTVQLISYLLAVHEQEGPGAEVVLDGEASPAGPALIICPTSVLGNWQKELERFAPNLRVYLHYGSNRLKEEAFAECVRGSDVVLTSYGLSHLDATEFEGFTWSSIAIDEAQNIKNAQTKQSRAVRRLKGRHAIALTGTPMENRLSELWSIFDFTNHGYLGSLGQFQKRFVIPIEKEEKKEKVQELQSLIRPFLLRRTKRDEEVALNLPDKQEQKEYCPLTAEQASLYEQLVRDTFEEIEKLSGFERKGLILQMLSRLKQLCNHPALYLKEKAAAKNLLDRSTKLEKLSELVEALIENGESCLIFTQYIEMGEMIKRLMKEKFKVDVPFLNGSVPKAQRDNMIDRFQNREFPVFLLSLKAGGTGLNLTAANHVIHYDRWWNPAVENQATDRAHRIGQQRFVHVHKLICTGTLEEKIDAMLEKKQHLNDQIIQSENWITELSTDDLHDLVKLT
ncbi:MULTISPECIES: DEAD/DEAH box helicase [unclassified Bacillus (in: firmicutes)]|uniref:DEAD/DEAH box helicase n=1 Tax=unclassified Bacillus (in: firmicutes) TaxID=185979 RepID=UPI0008F35AF5|nr:MULTISPECIES: DEAD/DEAH box helicase [unclassified Bacillus (in: firmicutes)]SFB04312.1 Superfamily II DNA or RNA helicase, SNF2 family [Bacillus sp. UNCCL13]SFQ88526.1 Superfamily II DNA or RNA helicase, SNF2 family [Bacillus sp. cl95]